MTTRTAAIFVWAAVVGIVAWADDVRLDLPETVELKVVVDYVAATLGLNVIYDETQLNKKLSLRVTQPVPKESLLGLLRTVLRGQGLALVPAEQEGWWKIVAADKLVSEGGSLCRDLPPPETHDAEALTYLLAVEHADLERIRTAITPYLSKPGGTALAATESRMLVVTDYAANVRRVVEIARLLDVPAPGVVIETIPVRHQDPTELAGIVSRLLIERARAETLVAAQSALSLQPDPLSGGLIALGLPVQIAQARELVERFDQPVERSTEIYQPRYMAASRLRSLVEQMLSGAGARVAVDEGSNTLVVTARKQAHAQLRALLERFDTAPPESAAPLRFYKLLNRRADDVFATLGGLLLGGTATATRPAGEEGASARPEGASMELGGTRFGQSVGTQLGPSRLLQPGAADTAGGTLQLPPPVQSERPSGGRGERRAGTAAVHGEGFALSLDEHTNSIIAIATPELHRQIEQLVQALDKRRPQVLVEVTLVSVSVDDSLDLGVELEALDLGDHWDYLLFTSFGLSSIDPTTGQRRLTPMAGGTGVLLGPGEVPIILRALASRGNTRVYSAPRILVDDNATGSIESVAESPFSSVNASNTVATTSFAGFAKAGTQLSIEPHIAEGDHLELNYQLTVSSFTGAGTGGTPPPRSSDTLSSTIRVPDGHTVIVGGLLTETLAESSSHVPLIGDVPIIGWLFGHQTHSKSKVRLYAFIRPTILRHEDFEDLKYLSGKDVEVAGVSPDDPPNRFQYMK